MKIGEISRLVGVSSSIIRYYERIRLLHPACRDEYGYRVYTAADLERIQFVTMARQLGLSVRDIREVLATRDAHQPPVERVRLLLTQTVDEVAEQMKRLRSMRSELMVLRDRVLSSEPAAPSLSE